MKKFFASVFHIGDGISPSKGQKIGYLCGKIISLVLWVTALVLPLFFLPEATEVLEFHKQAFLFVAAAVATLAWLGKMLSERKVQIRHSVSNVLVAVFAVVYTISTIVSQNPSVGFMGGASVEKNGLLSVLSFVALYFVAVNTLSSMKQVRRLLSATLIGGFIVAGFSVLQLFGFYALPYQFAQSVGFSPIGTPAALAVYLAFITTLSGGLLLAPHGGHQCKGKWCGIKNFVLFLLSLVPLFILAVVAFWPVLVSVLVGSMVLVIYAILHVDVVSKGVRGIILPITIMIVSLFVLFWGFPIKNVSFPSEVMPSLKATAKIAYSTLRDYPLFGSGPSTFVDDYARYRSIEVNQTDFWNLRFDRGASRVLTLAATTGIFGVLTYLLLIAFIFFAAARAFLKRDEETWHTMIGVFAGWCVLVVSRFLYSSNLTLEFLFWFTTALLVITIVPKTKEVEFAEVPRAGVIASFFFIFTFVGVAASGFIFSQRYIAERAYVHAYELRNEGASRAEIAEQYLKAVEHQSKNDVYLRALSDIRLVQAIENGNVGVNLKKEEVETDEQFEERKAGALQEHDRKTLAFASDAIAYAKRATEVAPSNVVNWLMLGSIYQNVMGITRGADESAVSAYMKAIELESNSPVNWTELGKVYLYQAEQQQTIVDSSEDQSVKKTASQTRVELLTKAKDAFTKAIELRADYAQAHYQLALTLDRQGQLKDAINRMEAVVGYAPSDVGVRYQLALLYYRDGRMDDAIRLLEQVIKLSPTYSNARWHLASIYEEVGRLDDALVQLYELQKLVPEDENVKAKLLEVQAKKDGKTVPDEQAGLPEPVK